MMPAAESQLFEELFRELEAAIVKVAVQQPTHQLDVNLMVGTLLSLALKLGATRGMPVETMIAALQQIGGHRGNP